jgi:tripartite motif-containing protein 71
MKKILLGLVVTLVFFSATMTGAQEYIFDREWGTRGSGEAEFYNPRAVAVDSSGYVYVVDHSNFRIQKFDSNGNYITQWGRDGFRFPDDDSAFFMPEAIAVDSSGNVYVVDRGHSNNTCVKKFDSEGRFLTKWGREGSGDGEFIFPIAVAVDPSGYVYVADVSDERIQKFGSEGRFLIKWGREGSGNGEFMDIHAVAVDSSGNVYAGENSNYRVQEFDSEGRFLRKWGELGSDNGEFGYSGGIGIQAIAVDRSGNIYVADTANNRIEKFDSGGNYITKWGSEGSEPGQFHYPVGVAVDSFGNVYVVDIGNIRIQKFRPVFRDIGGSETATTTTMMMREPMVVPTTTTTVMMRERVFPTTTAPAKYTTTTTKIPISPIKPYRKF